MASTGKAQETIVAALHDAYYEQNYNGQLWAASLTSASAIPLAATNATPNFIIWNPAGNTTNVVLVQLNVGFAAGTGIAGTIGYSYLPNAGSSVGTGLTMSAFTAAPTQVQLGRVGTQYAGGVKFGTAATVTGTGLGIPVRLRWSCLSQGAPITTTAMAYSLYENFGGTVIIPPNTALYLDASVAIAETFMLSMIAYEAPI